MLVNLLPGRGPAFERAAFSFTELSRLMRSAYVGINRSAFLRHPFPEPLKQSRTYKHVANHNVADSRRSEFANGLSFPAATYDISDLESLAAPVEEIVVHGYLVNLRILSKALSFAMIASKDFNHCVQVVANSSLAGPAAEVQNKLKDCTLNTPVVVRGRLIPRKKVSSNDFGGMCQIKTKEIDLIDIQELNRFPNGLSIVTENRFGPDQRHLQIRQERSLRDALRFRSELSSICREWLQREHHFIEVETPLLFKSTPEGAREFLVPTRKRGYAYALPQSPQQFKQILMGSGISRYFQIARCFRDEDFRADRQPEFTQLDLEMSFATGEDVMNCVESLIRKLWSSALGSALPDETFPRMAYEQAMASHGSDKPDLRRGFDIRAVRHHLPTDFVSKITSLESPKVDCLHIKCGEVTQDPKATSSLMRGFMDSAGGAAYRENPEGAPAMSIVDSTKPLRGLSALGFQAAEVVEELYGPGEGDLLVLQARRDVPFAGGSTTLGRLGLAIHDLAIQNGLIAPLSGIKPLWITDFPLFTALDEDDHTPQGSALFSSTHHPFTSPKSVDDIDFLERDPLRAKADHYDLVINGAELGGGSRRIHSYALQSYVLKDILRMNSRRLADFSHLLDVLRAGCPPHAGIALGFDRLVAVMLGKKSIRDVIAFPKSGRGEDPLFKSPGRMDPAALRKYHLQLLNKTFIRPQQQKGVVKGVDRKPSADHESKASEGSKEGEKPVKAMFQISEAPRAGKECK